MNGYFSKELQQGLEHAFKEKKKRKSRIKVVFDGDMYPVLKTWDNGFSVDAESTPIMRGFVDLFEGSRHLSRCLIIASEQQLGELKFEFKRSTEATDKAPLDFEKLPEEPIALLT
tara:strand:- start:130 stop:474 length:345 start_codon:yes stop_codon:yes gene_type:complete